MTGEYPAEEAPVAEYTPTTEQVRDLYELGGRKASESAQAVGADVDIEETLAMFDRWLAAHDLEVAERALEPIRAAEAEWRRTPMERADVRFRSRVLAALRPGTQGSGQ